MCNAITDNNGTIFNISTIKNDKLRAITEEIRDNALSSRAHNLLISAKIAQIFNNKDVYIDEQFGNFETFAAQVLNLKKQQAYMLVRVGSHYLNENGECILPEPEGLGFTTTQLQAMLPLVSKSGDIDVAKQLTESGEISPDMSVKAIKEVVAENRPDAKAREAAKIKRDEKKAIQEKERQKVENEIKGKLVATIELRIKADGTPSVLVNGEIETRKNIINYLVKNFTK